MDLANVARGRGDIPFSSVVVLDGEAAETHAKGTAEPVAP